MSAQTILEQNFGLVSDLIRAHAAEEPGRIALIQNDARMNYGELDALVDRIAVSLQRDGVKSGEAVAVCASTSIEYAALFLGTLRAGAVMAPLAPSSTPESLAVMAADCGASLFFLDKSVSDAIAGVKDQFKAKRIALDGSNAGQVFAEWLAPVGSKPKAVEIAPNAPFNIIYSSGTTGTPKGIVQSHAMRWGHVQRAGSYSDDAVTMISTPLYSNTTLVCFFPTLGWGGACVLMAKFDAEKFLKLAEKNRATHAMLVPVQYQRLMDRPDFDAHDLSSFRMKFCTSAPFSAALKGDVLKRWPGGLVEYYGMTEGGASFVLIAHAWPNKLHTVGQPLPGHLVKLVGEDGKEVATGEVGEIYGASPSIMNGYHNQPEKTREAQWVDENGVVYMRTGDVGRFDEDGFLMLMDRKKDMIISGGFNIYPSDLEMVLLQHPAVRDCAVVAAPSRTWGETPAAFVVLSDKAVSGDEVRAWANERLGKTQRLAIVEVIESLPRSHIGKVLKRELRDAHKDVLARIA